MHTIFCVVVLKSIYTLTDQLLDIFTVYPLPLVWIFILYRLPRAYNIWPTTLGKELENNVHTYVLSKLLSMDFLKPETSMMMVGLDPQIEAWMSHCACMCG